MQKITKHTIRKKYQTILLVIKSKHTKNSSMMKILLLGEED